MLTGGAYSQKFKDLEQERLDKLNGSTSSEGLSHAQQMAARDKVRQLSLETNRRRRAQELKRRLEAQKEAKRRQEVLEERRKRQQDATQRYQRLQKGSPKIERTNSGKLYSESRLQDGVNMARGYNRPSTIITGNQSNLAPALEDALRMVGVNTAPVSSTSFRGGGYDGEMDYTTGYRKGYSDTGVAYNPVDYVGDIPFRRQLVDNNGNTFVENKGQNYHGYTTTATSTYNSNSNQDAIGTRYQQTLHEQQKQIMEQQQAALHEFNQAVLNEALPSQGEELERSSSVLSLDSLEGEQPNSQQVLSHDGYKKQPVAGNSTSVHSSGKLRNNDGYDITSVQTRSVYGNNESRLQDFEQSGKSAIPDNRLFTSNPTAEGLHPNANSVHSRAISNGELLLEETSESDFVREPVDSKPSLLQGSTRHLTYGGYSARMSQAWVSQAPTDGSNVKNTMGHISSQSGQRPFSARTTATAVTSYPARIPDSPVEYNHYSAKPDHVSVNQNIPASVPSRAFSAVLANARYNCANEESGSKYGDLNTNHSKSKYNDVSSTSYVREHSSFEDPQSTGKQHQLKSSKTQDHGKTDTSQKSEKTVRSILKRSPGTSLTSQKVKLGVMKVKDSLEISRATQMVKTDRKSVRWTDMKYADNAEEKARLECETVTDKSDVTRTEKPKPPPTRPVDEATRGQMNGKRRTASAGTQPRKPTLLPRMAQNSSKPPPGRSNQNTPVKQPEPDNSPVVSRISGKVISQESNKYSQAHADDGRLYQNGIRLDKTPTDDEINWLWDKVRTCLHTQEHGTPDQVSDTSSSRQPASVSKQSIDGNRLTANLRMSTPSTTNSVGHHQDHSLTQQKYNTYPRLRTNSASSTASLRKTALLQQRRQHSTAVGSFRHGHQGRNHQQYTGPVPGMQPSPPSGGNHHPGPTVSTQGPMRTAAGVSQGQEVSDSLLAFQQAERLAQENLSESEMAAVLEEQKDHMYTQKVPSSALSMEEQRILESLDKLNTQLRTVSSDTKAAMQPYVMIQPKPPLQGSGYRSQRPLSCRQRAVSDANMSHRSRTLSADRTNARINYRH